MIKILVDSASDCALDQEYIHGVVPVTITIGNREYTDGIDLNSNLFYELLTSTKEFPKTAQPTPQAFLDYFAQAKEKGDEVIYFSLSSALSGTYQSAVLGKNMVEYEKIYLVDSLTATHAISILARHAAKLAAEGLSAEEIVRRCNALKSKIKLLAGVDTLEYLYRGGRLSRTSAAIGELANIKPIITVTQEGTVSAIGKSLGRAGAMQFILRQLKSTTLDPEFPLCSLYTYGTENCEQLENTLTAKGYMVSDRLQVGASIGAHVGPEVYGILFVTK